MVRPFFHGAGLAQPLVQTAENQSGRSGVPRARPCQDARNQSGDMFRDGMGPHYFNWQALSDKVTEIADSNIYGCTMEQTTEMMLCL